MQRPGGRTGALAALALLLCGLAPRPAGATGRLFTYSYESGVLNRGEVEFEPWVTWRFGRNEFYSRFDQRYELEIGLTDRLQTALYLNTQAVTEETGAGRASDYEFAGVSSEWKYKFSDPMADRLGFALYLEGTLSTSEAEIEQKFIFDRQFHDFAAVLNVVSEFEWEFGGPSTDATYELEITAGLAYELSEAFSVGIELRNANEFPDARSLAHSALFLGPAASYTRENWWAALTVLPQLAAFHGATRGGLALDGLERIQVRLLLGFHL